MKRTLNYELKNIITSTDGRGGTLNKEKILGKDSKRLRLSKLRFFSIVPKVDNQIKDLGCSV
jgi:hypothetical protein